MSGSHCQELVYCGKRAGHLSRLVNRYESMLLSTDAESFDGVAVNCAQRFVQGGYTSLQNTTGPSQPQGVRAGIDRRVNEASTLFLTSIHRDGCCSARPATSLFKIS